MTSLNGSFAKYLCLPRLRGAQETYSTTPVGAVSNRTGTQHLPYILSEKTTKATRGVYAVIGVITLKRCRVLLLRSQSWGYLFNYSTLTDVQGLTNLRA